METYLDKNGNSAYIHLLNLTGENRYTIGEPMPVLAPKIPLSLREDIVIEIEKYEDQIEYFAEQSYETWENYFSPKGMSKLLLELVSG